MENENITPVASIASDSVSSAPIIAPVEPKEPIELKEPKDQPLAESIEMLNSTPKEQPKEQEAQETPIIEQIIDPNMQSPTEDMLPPQMTSLITSCSSDNILSKLININADSQIFHEPTCSICCSPHRKEIETQHEEMGKIGKDYKSIVKFAKSKGINLSAATIVNHMEHHTNAGIREIQKVEYIDRINRLTTTHTSALQIIEDCIAALRERMLSINSIVPNSTASVTEIEKLKTEGTTKIIAQITALLKIYSDMLNKMKANSDNVISIPTEPFITIFNEAIAKAKNEDQREVINNLLQKLTTIKI